MTDRAVGNSPLEVVLLVLFLAVSIAAGLLWAAGLLVGGILGAVLPGSLGAGFMSLVVTFPELGRAWQPPIPSVAVWLSASAIGAVLGPVTWKVLRAGRLKDGGARWATVADLRGAGLLIKEQSQPHAIQEKSSTPETR